MAPHWLHILARVGLALGFASTLTVAYDIFARGYRQRMAIVDVVWPVTALYFGPVGVWGYLRLGRPRSRKASEPPRDEPGWHPGSLSASPWGAETRSSCCCGESVFVDDAAEQVASHDLRRRRHRNRSSD